MLLIHFFVITVKLLIFFNGQHGGECVAIATDTCAVDMIKKKELPGIYCSTCNYSRAMTPTSAGKEGSNLNGGELHLPIDEWVRVHPDNVTCGLKFFVNLPLRPAVDTTFMFYRGFRLEHLSNGSVLFDYSLLEQEPFKRANRSIVVDIPEKGVTSNNAADSEWTEAVGIKLQFNPEWTEAVGKLRLSGNAFVIGDDTGENQLEDTSLADTTLADTTLPDTTPPYTTPPYTTPPYTTLPDTTLPDTTLPDTTLPDTTLPDTTLESTTWESTTWESTTWESTTWKPRTWERRTRKPRPLEDTKSEDTTTLKVTTLADTTLKDTTTDSTLEDAPLENHPPQEKAWVMVGLDYEKHPNAEGHFNLHLNGKLVHNGLVEPQQELQTSEKYFKIENYEFSCMEFNRAPLAENFFNDFDLNECKMKYQDVPEQIFRACEHNLQPAAL